MTIPSEDINNRFKFHPANTPERREAHEQVRAICRDMAHVLNSILPDGREKALAFTHLEEVMLWSNAGIARQSEPVD